MNKNIIIIIFLSAVIPAYCQTTMMGEEKDITGEISLVKPIKDYIQAISYLSYIDVDKYFHL